MADPMKIERMERARTKLVAPDSIFEPDVYPSVVEFLRNGGTPLDVVAALSDNFVGYSSMCNLVADDWCSILEIDGKQIMRDTIKALIVQRFDPDQIDRELMPLDSPPEWLTTLIEDQFWRNLFYELSESHTKCQFINYAIQVISDAGYQSEITSAASASTHFNVFKNVLLDALQNLKVTDETSFGEHFAHLEKICTQDEHTYLYSQALLKQLIADDPVGWYPLRRVIEELEHTMVRKYRRPQLLTHLNLVLAGLPVHGSDVASAITALKQRGALSPGDVVGLYKAYRSPYPSSVEHLRDPQVIEYFLQVVFLPPSDSGQSTGSSSLRPEIREKYLWLLALAVSATGSNSSASHDLTPGNDTSKSETTLSLTTDDTFELLQELYKLLPAKPTAADLARVTGVVLEKYIDVPVLAAALIIWIRHVLRDDGHHFYVTYFRVTEVPYPHLLLEEIAFRHPLLRPKVFHAFQEAFTTRIDTLGPELVTALQKSVLDRLLYLMQLGFSVPVLRYIKASQDKIDESLTVHFVCKVLEMITTPYAPAVITIFLEILEPVLKAVIDSHEHHLAVSRLVDELMEEPKSVLLNAEILPASSQAVLQRIHDELPGNTAFE
ncbi:hypothetical protein IWQ61_008798 [Dispira simplex]|nr:hypothetical protein IWQ61_008798 [Dispira simplex]